MIYQVCLALGIMGGDYYQRTGGLIGGITQSAQCKVLRRVVRAINSSLKDDFLHMPSEEMLRSNSEEYLEKYHLPGFGYAVDGVHMVFEQKPRNIPLGYSPKDFCNRKSRLIELYLIVFFIVHFIVYFLVKLYMC